MSATNRGTRLLFHAYNRRGLGHLMRGMNLARAVCQLDPDCRVRFYTRSSPPPEYRDPGFEYVAESDAAVRTNWADQVRSFSPDVLVYDTILPKAASSEPPGPPTDLLPDLSADQPPVRRVMTMRQCKPQTQQELFDSPFVRSMDLILIPHTPEEFGYTLPEPLAAKAVFTGPIVRQPDPDIQDQLRDKYGFRPGDFILTSTVGGGGFEQTASLFFQAVFEAHHGILHDRPGLRHMVVQGPNYTDNLTPLQRMTVIRSEPQMVNLLALSDLVIAEGGYNTVHEIRLTKTPAVFLPGPRSHDDQLERVRRLEDMGLAHVLADMPQEQVAQKIHALTTSDTALRDMRLKYRRDKLQTGNQAAARHILELARR